ncbi:hypothetical protein BJX99DRAFT_254322 [Aspergillus californicus]
MPHGDSAFFAAALHRGLSIRDVEEVGFGCCAGLSQLKWVWFAQQKRPLSDLRAFDNASRGIYGSAELLLVLRMRHFAVLGAIAVLLAVGFKTFVQNLVHYSPDLVVDASRSCRLANTTNYDKLGLMERGTVNNYIEPALKVNIYNSIFRTDPEKPWAISQHVPNWQLHLGPHDAAPYDNCTVSLPNGTSAYQAGGYKSEAIALQVQSSSQPIVYTNATLPVIKA